MDKFANLPPELRYIIWDLALQQEARDRLIVVCRIGSPRFFPLKHHASPLLSVCRESRYLAERFYSLKLNVYEAQLTDYSYQPSYRHHQYGFKTRGVLRGCMYVSSKWDFFISIESTDIVTNIRARLGGLRCIPPPDYDVLRPFVTDVIPPSTVSWSNHAYLR
ncbi:hypothetical protein GGS26DRAFT_546727 [Hypomontagnella submonticulosa]|nr:hypothetical protein GGS26DRAFT_546727 [Hypomontagnella submonticulosa]